MVNPVNDIFRQARQGSVAAVIQVLNDKLADSGVRTRAIFADGVLQLLCEAASVEQLEQSTLVERVRQILEGISPSNIRRVNINSRIVREQQLLWLEEISRDPENQLLWSQEITLARPNLMQRWLQSLKDNAAGRTKLPQTSTRSQWEKRHYQRGILGGMGLTVVLAVGGWAAYRWFDQQNNLTTSQAVEPSPAATPLQASPTASPSPSPVASPVKPNSDAFADAVRLAEQASGEGRDAQTAAAWLAIAAKWQQASDLMASVEPQDQRYKTAQNRTVLYRKNSESALQQAQQRQTNPTP